MKYVFRFIIALIILAILITSWYGAEMMIYGESQRSVIDLVVAVLISLTISGSIVKGVEESERKRKTAEHYANEFVKYIQEREKTKNGENESRS